MDFSSWLDNRKPPYEVATAVEIAGLFLGETGSANSFRYRVEPGSNYEDALKRLAEDPEQCYQTLEKLDASELGNDVLAAAQGKLQAALSRTNGPAFSPQALYTVGGDEMRLLAELILNFFARFKSDNSRPVVNQKVIGVCVDGSRMSYMALNLAARLRYYGQLVVMHVIDPEESSKDGKYKHWEPSFLLQDVTDKCKESYGINESDFTIAFQERSSNQTVGTKLEGMIKDYGVEVVVVGAYGRHGPRVVSTGRVTTQISQRSQVPTIVVNSHAQHLVLAPSQAAFSFLLAVKATVLEESKEMLKQTMELMRPKDSLLVIYVAEESTLSKPANCEHDNQGLSVVRSQPTFRNQMNFPSKSQLRTVKSSSSFKMDRPPSGSKAGISKAFSLDADHNMSARTTSSKNVGTENENAAQIILNELELQMQEAQVTGNIKTIKKIPTKTIAEHICEEIELSQIDFLVLKFGGPNTVSQECGRTARCSVTMLKI